MGPLTTVLLFIYFLPKKYAKCVQKSQSATKHCMFRAKNYASPENFTPALLVMLKTFRRSAVILSHM